MVLVGYSFSAWLLHWPQLWGSWAWCWQSLACTEWFHSRQRNARLSSEYVLHLVLLRKIFCGWFSGKDCGWWALAFLLVCCLRGDYRGPWQSCLWELLLVTRLRLQA